MTYTSCLYIINRMKLEEAQEIVRWRYDSPYSLYDMSDDEEDIQELMDGTYFSAKNLEDELIGFFCFGLNAQINAINKQVVYCDQTALDIGLGLRPDLTGQGKGKDFLMAGIHFAQNQYTFQKLRLSVAAFNKRAISLYQNVGFVITVNLINKHNKEVFFLMEKECEK